LVFAREGHTSPNAELYVLHAQYIAQSLSMIAGLDFPSGTPLRSLLSPQEAKLRSESPFGEACAFAPLFNRVFMKAPHGL
jgi:hypothetical protein